MPNRTWSNRASGSRMPAELAARCRNGDSTPSPAATATAAWNSASAAASCSGEASARCDQSPAMRSSPASSASRAALTSAGQSSGLAPLRCRPVSTLRCTAAGAPLTAFRMRWSSARDDTPSSMSASIAAAKSVRSPWSQANNGTSTPASRSAMPAGTSSTAIAPAPPSTAARAKGTIPCPYAFAFTAIMHLAGAASSARARTLSRNAPRSRMRVGSAVMREPAERCVRRARQ
jgi:hypothetical protein